MIRVGTVPPRKSVPEHKCFKMHHVESESERKMQTIPGSQTNYSSFNEGVLPGEEMLAGWDQARAGPASPRWLGPNPPADVWKGDVPTWS